MNPAREVVMIFMLAETAIWLSKNFAPISFGLGLFALSFIIRYWFYNRQNSKNLFLVKKIINDYDYWLLGFIFFFSGLSITHLGQFINPDILEDRKVWVGCWNSLMPGYLLNAFWQQLLVLGYFVPRLQEEFKDVKKTSLWIGIAFALIHLPNPVLVPATFIGGAFGAYFFQRTRNFYALVLAHAILAVLIMHFLPESWHHHMKIGPIYFSWTP